MLDELFPYVAHLVLAHLTVRIGDTRVGEEFLQAGSARLYSLNAVVDIVDLTAAAELADDSLNYRAGVVFDNVGLNGISVLRRLFKH